MTFGKYLCWDPDRVHSVMNTNAELADRAVFLAIHSEFPLRISGPVVGDVAAVPKEIVHPRQFLDEFLSPARNHVQVMILGESGSGKSHFVKWMQLNIPDDKSRQVIAIPRTGVGLRGIIEAILALLPKEDARPYRDELEKAGREYVTREDLKYALVLSLAAVIRGSRATKENGQDLEDALIRGLPDLLADPFVYMEFWADHPMLQHVVDHVLSPPTMYGSEVEPNWEFRLSDLPSSMADVAKMSNPAQQIMFQLNIDQQVQLMAIEILNRNLDAAISRVVGLSAERLVNLIQEVRRYLAAQKKELILLFEDMALSQGLSGALFDALLDEGRPDDDKGLCRLRWAGAVTTGYYTANIPETVKTRVLQVIHTDLMTFGEEATAKDEAVVGFAARYLNAARLDWESLTEWATHNDAGSNLPPNACESCDFRSECHAAFGESEDQGLYPFNRNALLNALRRSDPAFDYRFNPRFLVQNVLATTLDLFARDIEEGIFPTARFLERMGGHQVPPALAQELSRQSPGQASQQVGILGFWATSAPGRFVDEPSGLYEAFGVGKPEIGGLDPPENPPEGEPPGPDDEPSSWRRSGIADWGNGASIRDNLLNSVRPMLFEAIVSHIDWDSEGILRTRWAGSGMPFRPDSISFVRQTVQVAQRPVMLRIPMDDDPDELIQAAVALEGLEFYREQSTWAFPGGGQRLRALGTSLDRWSSEVVRQIRALSDPMHCIDVVSTGVELLAVGAALAGRPARTNPTIAEILNALFEEWPRDVGQSAEWQNLHKRLERQRSKIQETVLGWTTASKGGVASPFLRPASIIKALRALPQGWQLSAAPSAGKRLFQEYEAIATLHSEVALQLPVSARREWEAKTEWLPWWRAHVDVGTTRKSLLDSARALVDLAVAKSIPHQATLRRNFEEAITRLEGLQLDDAVRTAHSLSQETNPENRLRELGRDRGRNATAGARDFIDAGNRFASELTRSLTQREQERSVGNIAVQHHQSEIKESLDSLLEDLQLLAEPARE